MKITFTVPGPPVPKPRQTRSDRWKQRPCVVKYRHWADECRLAILKNPENRPKVKHLDLMGISVSVLLRFFLPLPKGKSKGAEAGAPHLRKPDLDNMTKSAMDAVFKADQVIYRIDAEKRWDDGQGPRTEIVIEWE